MDALITVGGYEFPEPSTYEAVTSTIVDSARNVKGYVIGNVVRSDVSKISVTWKYLTADQWATILSCFASSFYNEVRFLDQTTNTFNIKKMYVSDRNASMWRRNPTTGDVMGYLNCSLSLVEV